MDTQTQATAEQMYAAQITATDEKIVSVTVPSGFVFQFAKPSRFSMLFRTGVMPQVASSGAVDKWIQEGILKPGDFTDKQKDNLNTAIKLRDRVLEFSRVPKLVVGEALNPNELSTDKLSDADAEYLFQWVAAGGETSSLVGRFPAGQQPNPAAGRGKRKVRAKAK